MSDATETRACLLCHDGFTALKPEQRACLECCQHLPADERDDLPEPAEGEELPTEERRRRRRLFADPGTPGGLDRKYHTAMAQAAACRELWQRGHDLFEPLQRDSGAELVAFRGDGPPLFVAVRLGSLSRDGVLRFRPIGETQTRVTRLAVALMPQLEVVWLTIRDNQILWPEVEPAQG